MSGAKPTGLPRPLCRLVVSLVLIVGLLAPRPAAASSVMKVFAWILIVGEVMLVTSGAALAITNGVYAGHKKRQPPAVLLVLGYTTGVGNIAAGTFLLSFGRGPRTDWQIGLGSTNLVIGAVALGMTGWAHARDPGKPPSDQQGLTEGLQVGPVLLRGKQNTLNPGLMLRYVY